MSPLNY